MSNFNSERVEIGCYEMDAEGVLKACSYERARELVDQGEDSLIVARSDKNGVIVSTAFLPICLPFDDGRPQAFETVVVMPGKLPKVRMRYADLVEALRGHDEILAKIDER